jgi:hypothetical protein
MFVKKMRASDNIRLFWTSRDICSKFSGRDSAFHNSLISFQKVFHNIKMFSLTQLMIGLCVFSVVQIGICMSININNECSDVSMNHSLGYLLSINSAIFAMTITYFLMSSGEEKEKFSKEALAVMALALGGVSLALSISIVSAADSTTCKANTKGWFLVAISGVVVLLSIVVLGMSFRKSKTSTS